MVIGARDAGKAEEAVASLRKEGVDRRGDSRTTRSGPRRTARSSSTSRGPYGKLDVLVTNAGVLQEQLIGQSVLTVDESVIEETFAVNVLAVVRLTRTLLPLLEKAEAGRIVNVSSILGSLTLHAAEGSPIEKAKSFAYNAVEERPQRVHPCTSLTRCAAAPSRSTRSTPAG